MPTFGTTFAATVGSSRWSAQSPEFVYKEFSLLRNLPRTLAGWGSFSEQPL